MLQLCKHAWVLCDHSSHTASYMLHPQHCGRVQDAEESMRLWTEDSREIDMKERE